MKLLKSIRTHQLIILGILLAGVWFILHNLNPVVAGEESLQASLNKQKIESFVYFSILTVLVYLFWGYMILKPLCRVAENLKDLIGDDKGLDTLSILERASAVIKDDLSLLEKETEQMARLSQEGNKFRPLRYTGGNHHCKTIVENLNRTQAALTQTWDSVKTAITSVAEGRIPQTPQLTGELAPIAASFTQIRTNMTAVQKSVEAFSTAATQAKFDLSIDTTGISGCAKPLFETFNKVLKMQTQPIVAISEKLQKLSEGEIPKLIEPLPAGDYRKPALALNQLCELLTEKIALIHSLANDISASNLSLVRNEKDQIGYALSKMSQQINEHLKALQQITGSLGSGSEDIASACKKLAESAVTQASSLEEITSSLNEISTQTQTNAGSAKQADTLAKQASSAASEGSDHMQEMVEAMNNINSSSQQIAKIIKTIDDIAFQTNLLALNAAVEAARAGRHGKGFAVVADEVRNLAGRSAKAARETAELIESATHRTKHGLEVANSTSQSFTQIVDSIQSVTELVTEISSASNEQAQAINQVNSGLLQIDKVTQGNTATAEFSATTSQELCELANRLGEMMQQFGIKKINALPGDSLASSADKSASTVESKRKQFSGNPSKTHRIQLPMDKKNEGWGFASSEKQTPRRNSQARGGEALDDTEFGKY